MYPEIVTFRVVPGRYQILNQRCKDITCSCTIVTFQLHEVRTKQKGRKGRSAAARAIKVQVDVPSWQEHDAPQRPEEEAAMVAEFLRDYPVAERERLAEWFSERERILRRLDEVRVDPVEVSLGRLYSFSDFLAPPDDPYWRCPLGQHWYEHEGDQYLVTEDFCINPECDCKEVHLAFQIVVPDRDRPNKHVTGEPIIGRMSLDGKTKLWRRGPTDEATAKRVLADWEGGLNADFLKGLKWRYDKIREIGRRSVPRPVIKRPAERLDEVAAADITSVLTRPRIGRNDPCPCGSGKKYKKCCARISPADPLED